MAVIYFVAGFACVGCVLALVGLGIAASLAGTSFGVGTAVALLAGAVVTGAMAWWAARRSAARWPG